MYVFICYMTSIIIIQLNICNHTSMLHKYTHVSRMIHSSIYCHFKEVYFTWKIVWNVKYNGDNTCMFHACMLYVFDKETFSYEDDYCWAFLLPCLLVYQLSSRKYNRGWERTYIFTNHFSRYLQSYISRELKTESNIYLISITYMYIYSKSLDGWNLEVVCLFTII